MYIKKKSFNYDSLLENRQKLNCYKTFKLMYFGFHDATINIHFFLQNLTNYF